MRTKIIFSLVILLAIISITTCCYAGFSDVPEDSTYKDAVDRMFQVGVVSGTDSGQFKPYNIITREQFIKMVVAGVGLGYSNTKSNGKTPFTDVPPGKWSAGYIGTALAHGFISLSPEKKFYPHKDITFAQACTIAVQALGIKQSELSGIWPQNYINKAKELGLTDKLYMNESDKVPKWAAAVILDRLWLKNLTKKSQDYDKMFSAYPKMFSDHIILGNSLSSNKIAENQVLTDKGTFFVKDSAIALEPGKKYKLIIDGENIIKASNPLGDILEVCIEDFEDNKITFTKENKPVNMILAGNIKYYFHGEPVNYNDLKSTLQRDYTIIFASNDNRTGYSYAVIFDTVYSKPEIAKSSDLNTKKIGSIVIGDTAKIIKNGKPADRTQIKENDVVYQITDYLGNQKYILVEDKRIEGKITEFLLNKSKVETLQIDNKNYCLSSYMERNKAEKLLETFKKGDKISALLGYDDKIVDVLKINYKSGPYMECIILGNSQTSDKLTDRQVLTDKGIFYLLDDIKLEIGERYKLIIDEDVITKVDVKLSKTKSVSVKRLIGTSLFYTSENSSEDMILPDKTTYYFDGIVQKYENLKNIIQSNTSIIFTYNESRTGYEYAVVFNPIYSKPLIDKEKNVYYTVTDIWGNNSFSYKMKNNVSGIIQSFLPNNIYPSSIKLHDGSVYEFGKDMDFDKLGDFAENRYIVLILGYDGKVIEVSPY
jgi:hypothetical protein